MQISLNSEAQKFIDAQIQSGRYRSPEEVLEAALGRLMIETEFALDSDTVAAINRAEDQLARGEGLDFDQFAAQWRNKLSTR